MRIIRHKPLFQEKVLLIYNGKRKRITLKMDYNVGAKSFSEAAQRLQNAAGEYEKSSTESTYKNLQEETKRLFSMGFGEESANEIFDFFCGDAISMAYAFTPFITNVVNPKIEKETIKRAKQGR